MPVEFKLPDVGEGIAEGEIVQWLVSEGDTVAEDQPIVEIETDKALVEIPSPVEGQVKELRANAGDIVPVGTVIIVFEASDDESDVITEEDGEPEHTGESDSVEREVEELMARDEDRRVFASPSVRGLARELGINLTEVTGTGPGGRVTETDVRTILNEDDESSQEVERTDDSPNTETSGETRQEPKEQEEAGQARSRTLAAPATRRVANELGIDINAVPPVEYRDDEAFVTTAAVRAFAEADHSPTESISIPAGEGAETSERIPYRGLRRTIGQQMEQSAFTAPHVTHHDVADATELVETRSALKDTAEDRGFTLTFLPFAMKSVVGALKEFPVLNSELDEENEEIIRKHYYNIGFATATEAGLLVPVIRDVESKSIHQLAVEADELASKARDRSITREKMQEGTFTITNFGAIGGEFATPIINYPEVAILGLGAIKKRPRVVNDEVTPRQTLPISVSIDHRVVDGADAARFTNRLIEYLENPTRLLLE